MLPPALAVFADVGVMFLAVLNSLRMRREIDVPAGDKAPENASEKS